MMFGPCCIPVARTRRDTRGNGRYFSQGERNTKMGAEIGSLSSPLNFEGKIVRPE